MWRQDELNRINQTTSGAERKAALCMLLEQETHLIASIGRHKIVANEKGKEIGIKNFLEAVRKQHTYVHVLYMYSVHVHCIYYMYSRCASVVTHVHVQYQTLIIMEIVLFTYVMNLRHQLLSNGLHMMVLSLKWTQSTP